jgi:hypothetical protein
MDIRFCDVCSESVPHQDLESGRARLRGAKLVCANCEAAMSAAPAAGGFVAGPGPTGPTGPGGLARADAPSSGARGSLAGVVLGGIALAGLAVAWLVLEERSRRDRAELGAALAELEVDLPRTSDDLRDEIGDLGRATLQEVAQVAAALSELRGRFDAESAARAGEGAARAAELAELVRRMALLQDTDADVERALARVDDLAGELAALRQELALAALRSATAPPPAGASKPEESPEHQPDWIVYVEKLASPRSGDRWSAVQALGAVGQKGDLGVVPYLVPMLSDADAFVRMATARMLGDMKALKAVGALIDALEDSEEPVRTNALLALKDITGRDFGYDPRAAAPEREKRVKAWREWWKKASEEGGVAG